MPRITELPYDALRGARNSTAQPALHTIEFNLVDHCNLNCGGCSRFSPLADKTYFADPAQVEKDFKCLYDLTLEAQTIFPRYMFFMGGEPLLHPKVVEFIDIVRKYLPGTELYFATNGILLPKQDDAFWEACQRNNITVEITGYPTAIDFSKVLAKAQSYAVNCRLRDDGEDVGTNINKFTNIALDPSGKTTPVRAFLTCCFANSQVVLREGRIYTCPIVPRIHSFNQYFQQNLKITPRDSIDIHQAKNYDEILQFLARPIPFCRYCKPFLYTTHPWHISERKMAEWTVNDG
jgi:MoaA/NifB/PqqE/SkfB family radical SAM enzyme